MRCAEPDQLRAAADRLDEKITDHRSVAIVNLCFLPRGRGDHRPSRDGRGVAPAAERIDDQLAVGLARARLRRPAGPLRGNGCGVVRALASRRGREQSYDGFTHDPKGRRVKMAATWRFGA